MKNKIYRKNDTFENILRQIPLEKPSDDFTKNIIARIPCVVEDEKMPFYKRTSFIACSSIVAAAAFWLFYNAGFSWTTLVHQITRFVETLQDIFPVKKVSSFSPMLVAPIIVIIVIFLADRISAHRKLYHEQ